VIKDEVNIKILDLDLDTRKALVKKFKYEDPSAKYRPGFKLGRWDGCVNFFGIGGTTYFSMLNPIVEYLAERDYEIDVHDMRPDPQLQFKEIDEEYWGDKCWPVGHRFENQPIRLRDYQVTAINNFIKNPQGVQSIPTGSGKTILIATMCKLCEPYGRSIVIVPNKSLVEQTEEDFVNCGLDVGVYYGDRKQLNKTHTICTWQSLHILDKKSRDDEELITLAEFLNGVNSVIVDECHAAKASVIKKILTDNVANAPIRWGLTGTIPKLEMDFQSIRCGLGDVINHVTAKELQDQGVLSNCHINIVQTVEFREFGNYRDELKFLVTDSDRLEWLSGVIKEISKTGNTMVLIDRIETGKVLKDLISDSVFISGQVKTKDRKEEYQEVAVSDGNVLICTYGVAAVGINVPRLFNIVLLEPGKSFVRVIQSIGRGMRKAVDKNHINVYDITATTKYAKRHLTERKRFYRESQYPFTINKTKY
jgi:superfamily II DNA or RNA helicase